MGRQLFSISTEGSDRSISKVWAEDEFLNTFSPEYEKHDWGYVLDFDGSEHYFNELDAKKRILQLIEKSIEIADEDIEDCLNEIEELKKIKIELTAKKLNLKKEIESSDLN